MRPIDADALEKTAIPCEIHNGASTELCVPLYQIRNAPTLPNPCGNPCNFAKPIGEWYYSCQKGWHCSICQQTVKNMPTVMGKANFDYCPNCGVKMK